MEVYLLTGKSLSLCTHSMFLTYLLFHSPSFPSTLHPSFLLSILPPFLFPSLPLSILPLLQIDKCVYTHMKLEFAGMRTQVYDLWSHGKNVSCGAVVKTTRVHILKHVFQFQDGLGMRQGTESNVASFPSPSLPPAFCSF